MSDSQSNNKRIAKNTLFLYFRMFVTMATSLFTSRIVLDVLGAADYGLNNVIGGVVVLFSFINAALLAATQRYLNFSLGQDDKQGAHTIFCMSMNTYFILSAIVILLSETVGLWFVENKLNIPEERMYAAHWVYQFTIVQFVLSLLRIPYNAVVVAHERLDFYAYTSIVDVVARLVIVYLLYITSFDKLIIYSFLNTLVPILMFVWFILYCRKQFSIAHYKRIWDKDVFKKMFSFSGWSLFGSIANLGAQQGVNIILNIFYGVTVNAAAGIANQVATNVYGFISNFQVAFQPQIVKTYAAGETERFHNLIFKTSKFSYFMVLILMLPIMFALDGILEIWLKEVPEYTSHFCRLILGFMAIESITAPLWMSVQATGKIKTYQILMALFIALNVPLSYISLRLGYPPYAVYVVRILVNIVVFVVRCIYMKRKLDFPLWRFTKEVMRPIAIVTLLSLPLPFVAYMMIDAYWPRLISVVLVSLIVSSAVIYYIGLVPSEREMVIGGIKKKLHKNK